MGVACGENGLSPPTKESMCVLEGDEEEERKT